MEERREFESADGASGGELAEREFQEEHRHSHKHKHDEIGDEECSSTVSVAQKIIYRED